MTAALDKEGFLVDLNAWDEQIAASLARAAGVQLTAEHWAVIRLLRDFYRRTEVAPAMRPFVKLVRDHLGTDQGTSIHLMALFGPSPAKTAARIAGLPKPTNCL